MDGKSVAHIAALAKLNPDEQELKAMAEHLNRMVEFCKHIDEVDTTGIEAMFSASDCLSELREDIVVESMVKASDVLAGAPDRCGQYFRVPQLVQRDE